MPHSNPDDPQSPLISYNPFESSALRFSDPPLLRSPILRSSDPSLSDPSLSDLRSFTLIIE